VARTDLMKAAVFEGPGRLSIRELPVPAVRRPEDVLVEVEACGICGTDLHILEVPPGHPATPGVVLGHEFVGVVREVGPEATGLSLGTRVAVAANLACGSCSWCRRGLPNHCERFTTLGIFRDGGLARFVVAPARSCHPVSRDLPAHLAALTEPVSCVVHAVEQARLVPGESVAIFGAGPIGLIFLALFRAAGAGRTLVVEPAPLRRELASRMGATVCLDPGAEPDVAGAVREHTEGYGADVVVDAVGSQLAPALGCVRKAGRVVLFGMDAGATAEVRPFDITRNELTVLGTYVGTDTFPKAIRILEGGVADLAPIVSHRLPLEELPAGLEALRSGQAVKVVVEPGAGG
jgi:threonine dehydrogenase-like Zn-dependent dehydrogenase